MASLIMHLIVAEKVKNQLRIDNESLYLLGSIAPDAYHFEGADKFISHFYTAKADEKKSLTPIAFFDKYQNKIDKNYLLGYLIHLIVDEIWIDLVVRKRLGKKPYDPLQQQAYYQDFVKLNSKLQTVYNLENVINHFSAISDAEFPAIEELQNDSVNKMAATVQNQLKFQQEHQQAELNFFSLPEITDYLEHLFVNVLERNYLREYLV